MSSSISASDRARHTDELRRTREENENKQAQSIKKQKRELARIQEKHDQEIQELTEAYENKMENLRSASKNQLSKRDQNYQAQMDRLREIYNTQLRQKVYEQEEKRLATIAAFETDKDKTQQINDQQKNLLKEQFDMSLRERDANIRALGENSREALDKSLEEQRQRLNRKHEKETKALIDDRDTRLFMADRKGTETRDMYEARLKETQRLSRQNTDRINSNWESMYRENQKKHESVMSGRDQMLVAERRRMQENYLRATDEKLNELQGAYTHLKEQTSERLNREVNAASSNSRQAQNDRIIDMITNRRIRNIERDNLIEEYEKRMDVVNSQRDKTHEKAMEVSHSRVDDIVRKTEKLVSDTNRNNRLSQNVKDLQHRQEKEGLLAANKSMVSFEQNRANERIDKVMEVTNKAQSNQEKLHRDSLDQLRGNYMENLSSQREAHLESLQDTYMRMDQRLKQTENKYEDKLKNVRLNLEQKLEQTEEMYKAELKKQKETYENRIAQLSKGHNLEKKSEDLKFETKMSQLEEAHQRDLERIERRHREQMASLSQRMSSSKA